MEGHDYPGIRFMLEASLDKMKQMIKVDISTGDIITPGAVEYSYKLMFEDRSISIWTNNLETLLGEKLETIMARENANTRMLSVIIPRPSELCIQIRTRAFDQAGFFDPAHGRYHDFCAKTHGYISPS